jgi:hypothetical protein
MPESSRAASFVTELVLTYLTNVDPLSQVPHRLTPQLTLHVRALVLRAGAAEQARHIARRQVDRKLWVSQRPSDLARSVTCRYLVNASFPNATLSSFPRLEVDGNASVI